MPLSGPADPKWLPRQSGPSLWFAPAIAPTTSSRYLGASESAAAYRDYDLWAPTIARCDVIQTYVDPARETSTGTDGHLANLVRLALVLNRDIAMETGGPYGTVGYPTGASSATRDLTTSIANIVALGGALAWITMDHPISRVMDGLGLTLAQSVAQTVEYMQTIHAAYPAIKIGMIDAPTNWEYNGKARYPAGTYGTEFDTAFTTLMAAVTAAGEDLVFFHVDMPYEFANGVVASSQSGADVWLTRAAAIQTLAASYGVDFGMVINTAYGGGGTTGTYPGAPFAGSDALVQSYTLLFAEQIRRMVAAGQMAPLDHLVLETFYYYPRDLAPATTVNTYCETVLKAKAVFNT